MDISTSLALMNMLTYNIPVIATADEMEKRYEHEKRLRLDLFEHYDGTMPTYNKGPVEVITLMTVDHLRELDEEKGSMTVSLTFTFTWVDDRLNWSTKAYGGLEHFTKDKYEFMMGYDIWVPTIHMTDLPGSAKQSDIFMNHDVEMFVHYSGTIRSSVKVLVTTPCYFGFGEYPNDYQNCSFTLMTPYSADEFQFHDFGGAEVSFFMDRKKRVTEVQDFRLIDIDTQNYFMYLGARIVDYSKNTNVCVGDQLPHCRSYYRYNLLLKRVNKLVFAQLSVPMIVICSFVAISGILPGRYSLTMLMFSIGFQIMNIINLSEILPDDYNGMPFIAVMALLIMVETVGLIVWRVFIIQLKGGLMEDRENKDVEEVEEEKTPEDLEIQKENKEARIERKTRLVKLVLSLDTVMTFVLLVQFIGNVYIIMKNA